MPEKTLSLYARGKLLLTGEYAVLDGALALALPVRYGQELAVSPTAQDGQLHWLSHADGKCWFEAVFSLPALLIEACSDDDTARRLQQILLACRHQTPSFLADSGGLAVQTRTDFPRAWGLGTSSTLIAALARWSGADPYTVLFETMGGSGYDIACAFADGPLLYRLAGSAPEVQRVRFQPDFADQLAFVFLGKKQDSREGIRRYREQAKQDERLIEDMSNLTRQCLAAATLDDFCAVLLEHEHRIGSALNLPRAQSLYFSDFPGVVKSLGAWGGDFVLAAANLDPGEQQAYFRQKGFDTCIPFREMVL